MDPQRFKAIVWDYYRKSGRHDLPWRQTRDPYEILVSEVMLQQTQVSRVLPKYRQFLVKFPTAARLARARTADVLRLWQGLGYNRRALMLKRAAESVVRDFGGRFPRSADGLESLPGVGQSTRGAILAFAFGEATPYIETNIRSVFLHFFFKGSAGSNDRVHDREILPLIEKTLDRKDPRGWYYALMDYGLYLKQTLPNPSRRSAHHVRQSAFKGSNREVRAKIVRFVLAAGARGAAERDILAHIGETAHDVRKNMSALVEEGFMKKSAEKYRI